MLRPRPLECPACGHEGIQRQKPTSAGEARSAAAFGHTWLCRLCAYRWTVSAARANDEDAQPA